MKGGGVGRKIADFALLCAGDWTAQKMHTCRSTHQKPWKTSLGKNKLLTTLKAKDTDSSRLWVNIAAGEQCKSCNRHCLINPCHTTQVKPWRKLQNTFLWHKYLYCAQGSVLATQIVLPAVKSSSSRIQWKPQFSLHTCNNKRWSRRARMSVMNSSGSQQLLHKARNPFLYCHASWSNILQAISIPGGRSDQAVARRSHPRQLSSCSSCSCSVAKSWTMANWDSPRRWRPHLGSEQPALPERRNPSTDWKLYQTWNHTAEWVRRLKVGLSMVSEKQTMLRLVENSLIREIVRVGGTSARPQSLSIENKQTVTPSVTIAA